MIVCFDVDLTLLAASHDRLRPHTRKVLRALRAEGHDVYVWSAGGRDYAQQMCRRFGIDALILAAFGKDEVSLSPDFVVDDDPEMLQRFPGFLVKPYFAAAREDSALLEALAALRHHATAGLAAADTTPA